MVDLKVVPQLITAIGGLGTAAFGLVDACKGLSPRVNNIGFGGIKKTVQSLTCGNAQNALSQEKIIATVNANWVNGTDLSSQKAIAKSLIKLNLSPENAGDLATATGLDSGVLKTIATKIRNADPNNPLLPPENDVYGRFDLIVTALLDETYQFADNIYRNKTRLIAAIVAIVLAIFGGFAVFGDPWYVVLGKSIIVGLLATPLAPIAKDVSTALATAVNTMQAVKKP
jgi:hypothetical protein